MRIPISLIPDSPRSVESRSCRKQLLVSILLLIRKDHCSRSWNHQVVHCWGWEETRVAGAALLFHC